MKKSIAMAWADALESGEYQQGKGQLRDADNNFCCLGILCNLHAQAKPDLAKDQLDNDYYFGENQYPPAIVWDKWAGMKSNIGRFIVPDKGKEYWPSHNDLVKLNDGGKDFKYISEVIRKHYKEL